MANKVKGDEYEEYICSHLNELNSFTKAYLWKNVPEQLLYDAKLINDYNKHRLVRKNNNKINPLQDVGIDILLVKHEQNICFVQCKNYTGTIPLSDLAGFFLMTTAHEDTKGRVYYTSKLSSKIIEYCVNPRIKLIKKTMDEINTDESEIINESVKLYDYQKEIVELYKEHYKGNNKAILSMPCGTGKTIISCYIAKKYKRVIFISPLKQFAEQNITRFREYDLSRKCLLIDSDGERDINEIKKFLEANSKTLLSVTYASCDLAKEFLEDAFVIIDEFHNLSRANVFDTDNSLNKIIASNNKILYMSATPRIYEIENEEDDLGEDDITNIFGETVYDMDFKTAIENKYITDYKIYLPTGFDNKYAKLKKDIDEEIFGDIINALDETVSKQCCFLFEAIKNLGTLKCIVYFKNTKEIDIFIKAFNKLNKYYAYDYNIDSITYKDSKKERNLKLKTFNESDKISFLCSVSILNECIDIPSCNTIYVTYNCKSKISCIQRMCRAMRINKQNAKKVANILLFCEEIDDVLTYMSAVKELDLDFSEKIGFLECGCGLRGLEEIREKNNELNLQYKKKIIGIQEYRGFNWMNMLEKVKTYIDENGKRPAQHDKNKNIRQFGCWISTQQNNCNKKRKIMKQKETRLKWKKFIKEYKKYFLSNEEIWEKNLETVKKYIDENNRLPSNSNKNKDIMQLARWIGHQKKNYVEKRQIMRLIKIRLKWKKFVEEYKEYFISNEEIWEKTLGKVKTYINENNKRPSSTDKNKDVKQLGNWFSMQLKNYAKKRRVMKQKKIRLMWKEFFAEYKEYFLTHMEIWNIFLEKVKQYIDINDKRPSNNNKNKDVKQLAQWISDQQKNYTKKQHIMKQKEFRLKWKTFIKDYEQYFESKNKIWNEILERVKKYIDENNKRPSTIDKNKDIKKLAHWINNQQYSYEKKQHNVKRKKINRRWENFITQYKEYFPKYYGDIQKK